MSFDSSIDVETYNPIRGGYLQLLDTKQSNNDGDLKLKTFVMENRFDKLSDGVTLNTFERIRREQLKAFVEELEQRELRSINYKELAAVHKSSISKEDYRSKILNEIVGV